MVDLEGSIWYISDSTPYFHCHSITYFHLLIIFSPSKWHLSKKETNTSKFSPRELIKDKTAFYIRPYRHPCFTSWLVLCGFPFFSNLFGNVFQINGIHLDSIIVFPRYYLTWKVDTSTRTSVRLFWKCDGSFKRLLRSISLYACRCLPSSSSSFLVQCSVFCPLEPSLHLVISFLSSLDS